MTSLASIDGTVEIVVTLFQEKLGDFVAKFLIIRTGGANDFRSFQGVVNSFLSAIADRCPRSQLLTGQVDLE